MKNLIVRSTLLTVLLVWNSLLSAMPLLSADGSMLSGLYVNGTTYDVSFGDGDLEELFPSSVVMAPGWSGLSRGVSLAIFEALRELSVTDNNLINGCEDYEGIPGILDSNFCYIFTPDRIDFRGSYRADNFVLINDSGQFYVPPPFNVGFPAANDGSNAFTTWATFTEVSSSVPGPATETLLVLGLLILGARTRSIIWQTSSS